MCMSFKRASAAAFTKSGSTEHTTASTSDEADLLFPACIHKAVANLPAYDATLKWTGFS